MIHEYAIQPKLLISWAASDRDYAEFLREYGIGTPRLITSFPKKRTSKVRSYFLAESPDNSETLQSQRYLEMVNALVDSLVLRDGFECQTSDWIENTLSENQRTAFDVVLSETNTQIPGCLTPDSMYRPDSTWNHPRQKVIARTSVELERAISNLLRLATDKVVIVDTYGWNDRAVSTMKSLLSKVVENRVHSELPEVSLFFKKLERERNPSAENVRARILDGLGETECSLRLKVYEVAEIEGNDVFHNRCVLTEHGAVSLGNGLDLSNADNHTDEVTLLEREVFEKYWLQFVEDCCFEIISEA